LTQRILSLTGKHEVQIELLKQYLKMTKYKCRSGIKRLIKAARSYRTCFILVWLCASTKT